MLVVTDVAVVLGTVVVVVVVASPAVIINLPYRAYVDPGSQGIGHLGPLVYVPQFDPAYY